MLKLEGDLRQVVLVDEEKCTSCHQCISVCPVKFCNEATGDAVHVNADLCVGCGQCVDACTHEARLQVDDMEEFLAAVGRREKIAAIVAPAAASSYPGQFLRLNGWLKSLGVRSVYDVSFGAELTVKSYMEAIRKAKPACVISQPCPAIVSFIEIYRPELIRHLAPADSPMMHTMKMVREFYPGMRDAKFVVVSPCLAKRREFDEVGIGDFNVTLKSIDAHLRAAGTDLASFPEAGFDNPEAERAVLFSTPGGLLRTALREAPWLLSKSRKTEGVPSVYHYLEQLPGSIEKKVNPLFVDCLSCEKGCNGGPGTLAKKTPVDEIEDAVEKRSRAAQERYGSRRVFRPHARLHRLIDKFWKPGLYGRVYVDRSRNRARLGIPSEADIKTIFERSYKFKKEDVLNCSSCGYGDCRAMAFAIFNGLNKPENCRHYKEFKLIAEMGRIGDAKSEIEGTLSVSVTETLATIGEISKNIERLHDLIGDQSASVIESSATIQEMVANIASIARVLERNAANVDRLLEVSRQGKDRITEVAGLIASIASESMSLLETNTVIQGIAGRTNLLAMNAAIEAAHAGAYGQGFAVVADEIRKLATSAAEQSKQISGLLKKVKTSIDGVGRSSVVATESFQEILAVVETVRAQDSEIQSAMQEQSEGGGQVLDGLERINQITGEVRTSSDQMLAGSREILTEMKRLSEITETINRSMKKEA